MRPGFESVKASDNIDNTAAGGFPSVGQSVTIRSRDVRHVDDGGGFYARFNPADGSDPSDHYWPPERPGHPLRRCLRESMIAPGQQPCEDRQGARRET
jgi:hypothetical protein